MIPTTKDAYRLLADGADALAIVEANGLRIDVPYLDSAIAEAGATIDDLQRELRGDPVFKTWRNTFGERTNLGSRDQIAKVIFDVMGYETEGGTRSGKRASADKDALGQVKLPFVGKWLECEQVKYDRNTFLLGIRKETVDGFLHPNFNLHVARSYRSCVAKGTIIEVVRDVSKYPKGIPIENVKAGDFVYCYNKNCRLVIKKVLWAGKTGHREVVRIHWSARGKHGILDVTPEHKVRLANGKYMQAKDLKKNASIEKTGTKRYAKIHAMALGRTNESVLCPTGAPGLLDHRVVYQNLVGQLDDSEVVHHKDNNHLNNAPSNLQKMTLADHSRHHAKTSFTPEVIKKALATRLWRHRIYGDRWGSGDKNPRWIPTTKFGLLRMLSAAAGKWSKASMGFGTLKNKADLHKINLKIVYDRYDRNGGYISLGKLANFSGKVKQIVRDFGLNYKKAMRMLDQRGIIYDEIGRPQNPYGRRGKPKNNHRITKVEWIGKKVDVYDLEVEDCHNFIANEICVHNSSSEPNSQNWPIRDKVRGGRIRRSFIARRGHRVGESDAKGIEVRVNASINRDPVLLEYIRDPTKDMHRDMAMQIYCIDDPKQVTSATRNSAKGAFVFAQFYGDYYVHCAKGLWNAIGELKLTTVDGTPLKEVLAKRGIGRLGNLDPREQPRPGTFEKHLKEVEQDFWGRRFKVYAQWKEDWWRAYQRTGYFDTPTGFRVTGVGLGSENERKKNACTNYPAQGSAFHCLLWTLIQLQKWLDKYRMKTKIVGQIHDSMILDIHESEIQDVLSYIHWLVSVKLPKTWAWIITPMEMESSVAPAGLSWFDKRDWAIKGDRWRPV